mmetsp:Transcript_17177/g.66855  ORF Transcript_17177/g.66855 Transcript_17177/m.66855 type:complete len:536 (-) Transcript_17177:1948-3555(-)
MGRNGPGRIVDAAEGGEVRQAAHRAEAVDAEVGPLPQQRSHATVGGFRQLGRAHLALRIQLGRPVHGARITGADVLVVERNARDVEQVPAPRPGAQRESLLLAVEVEEGVVGKLVHQLARAEQAARAHMQRGQRRLPTHRHRFKHQHRMRRLELLAGPHHEGQQLGAGNRRHRLAVAQRERIGIGGHQAARVQRRAMLSPSDQAIVPAGLEPGVGVDLQEPALTLVQRHRDRPRPAWPARLQRVDMHPPHLPLPGFRQAHAGLGQLLLHQADTDAFGPAGLRQRAADRERQQRVAVGRDADEDGVMPADLAGPAGSGRRSHRVAVGHSGGPVQRLARMLHQAQPRRPNKARRIMEFMHRQLRSVHALHEVCERHRRRQVAAQQEEGRGAAVVPGPEVVPMQVALAPDRDMGLAGHPIHRTLNDELRHHHQRVGRPVGQRIQQVEADTFGHVGQTVPEDGQIKGRVQMVCHPLVRGLHMDFVIQSPQTKLLDVTGLRFDGHGPAPGCSAAQQTAVLACPSAEIDHTLRGNPLHELA